MPPALSVSIFKTWEKNPLHFCQLVCVCFRLESLMDVCAQGCERCYPVNSSILLAILPHLTDFHQLLLDPPKVNTRTVHTQPCLNVTSNKRTPP